MYKIFWCSKCEKYSLKADTFIKVAAVTESTFPEYKNPGLSTFFYKTFTLDENCEVVDDYYCIECGEKVVLENLAECPHKWKHYGIERKCEFCGKIETGKVTF